MQTFITKFLFKNFESFNISPPCFLSNSFWLWVLQDVQELFKGLAQPVGMYLVNFKGWNHLDFLWGRDAPTLVYDQIDKLFSRYSHPA